MSPDGPAVAPAALIVLLRDGLGCSVLAAGPLGAATSDFFAAAIIAIGLCGQFYHRRLPPGFGTSLLVCGVTAGLGLIVWHRPFPNVNWFYHATHALSALAVLWALFGWIAANLPEPPDRARPPGASSTFFAWSLVCGVAAVAMLGYAALLEMSRRLLDPDSLVERLPAAGLWDVGALMGATGIWTITHRRGLQPLVFLTLGVLAACWASLTIPAAFGGYWRVHYLAVPGQPAWWSWLSQLQTGFAALIAGTVIALEWWHRHRRARAWPSRLDDLLIEAPVFPGALEWVGVLAGAVLLVGVFQLVQMTPFHWQRLALNAAAATVSGIACLMLAHRRWSANIAELGMALVSLSVVVLACAASPWFAAEGGLNEYATRLPVAYNAILFALAVMAALWWWLSRFWRQQLLDDRPWTTAGRMIQHARLIGTALTGVGVVVAFQMALWPWRGMAAGADDSSGRMIAGLSAIGLFALLAGGEARRRESPAVATLAVALVASILIFVFIRLPATDLRGWITQHAAVIAAAAALPVLGAAEALPRTRWRCFAGPVWFLAVLVLPAAALTHLARGERFPSELVRPTSLGLLGAVYGLAGLRERRGAFFVLAAVLFVAAARFLWTAL